jgi:hypothetical protein
LLLTVKNNQRRLYRQIISQFRAHRHFPVEISDFETGHGRQVRCQLGARIANEPNRERRKGASWIVDLGAPAGAMGRRITKSTTKASGRLRLDHQPAHQPQSIAAAVQATLGDRKPVALAP